MIAVLGSFECRARRDIAFAMKDSSLGSMAAGDGRGEGIAIGNYGEVVVNSDRSSRFVPANPGLGPSPMSPLSSLHSLYGRDTLHSNCMIHIVSTLYQSPPPAGKPYNARLYSPLQKGWRSPIWAIINKQYTIDPNLGFTPVNQYLQLRTT
jgi:hypothetical protein